MQIIARYSAQSVQEATNLNRRLWQRAIRLATSARALVYLIAGLWLGFALILRGLRAPIHTRDIATGAAVLLLMAAIALFASWRQTAQIEKALRAQPEEQLTIDSKGLTAGSAFEPWSTYSSFQEGKSIIALHRHEKKVPARAIPTDSLTRTQTGELRSILLANLPEKL